MRILLTGDWHLGANTWRQKTVDRTPEIQSCLTEILEFLEESKLQGRPIELVLMSGDLVHYWVPMEADKQKWLLDYLYDISSYAPFVAVLGNHDWRGLTSIDKFARARNVHVEDRFRKLSIEAGSRSVGIVVLPYFDARRMLREAGSEGLVGARERGKQVVIDSLKRARDELSGNDYVVLLAHGAVEGFAYTQVGGKDVPIPVEVLDLFDFAFLGHIHDHVEVRSRQTQRLLGCYPGGVAKLDFGEEKSQQGFCMVELNRGQQPIVEFRSFRHQKALKTFWAENVSGQLLEELNSFTGYAKVVLRGSTLSEAQRLYQIESVVAVDLRAEERKEGEHEQVTFMSVEEAYVHYLDLEGVEAPLRKALIDKFLTYMDKARGTLS
ncbi:exonuclease SbcD [Coprothermobacteraceae bacterium]|nr:exonuclease SbcD [Coprothermobacteraceae bacterium]